LTRVRTSLPFLTVIALAAYAGLAIAANVSSPRPGTLRGHIEPSGHAKLRIIYRREFRANVREYTWHFYRVPLKCKGGPEIARYTVKGGLGVNNRYADNGRFGGGSFEGSKKRDREYVDGKLVDPNKAKGWVRVAGTHVPVRGGGTDKCDSGRLRWKLVR
jgi:hypothetical protein